MKKKLLATLLAVAMVLSVFVLTPVTSSAETSNKCGDVVGNGSITINDALEILKYLAKLESVINTEPAAKIAATGASRGGSIADKGGLDNRGVAVPTINDALEILKHLAKLDSYYKNLSCPCDWCDGGIVVTPPVSSDSTTSSAITTTTTTTTATTTPAPLPPVLDLGNHVPGEISGLHGYILPKAVVNEYYETRIIVNGATPLKWEIWGEGSKLPLGLTLNESTGVISGVPSLEQPEVFFYILISNSAGSVSTPILKIEVAPSGTITTTTTYITTTTSNTTTNIAPTLSSGNNPTPTVTTPSGVGTTTTTTTTTTTGTGPTTTTTTISGQDTPTTTTPAVSGPDTPTTTTSTVSGQDTPTTTTSSVSGQDTPTTTTSTDSGPVVPTSPTSTVSGQDTPTTTTSTVTGDGPTTTTTTTNGGVSTGTQPTVITTLSTETTTTVSVQPGVPAISLSQTGLLTFPSAAFGYGSQTRVPITINNIGTVDTGTLTIAFSGANADAFYTTNTSFGSGVTVAQGSRAFEIRPEQGLAVGTYVATLTVSGTGFAAQSFNVSFTVTEAGAVTTQPKPDGTPKVIYDMHKDRDIHLYHGNPSVGGADEARSLHPLLKSNGGAREVNLSANPYTITIKNRGGSSQGFDVLLSALNAKSGHSYEFEFIGKVTSDTGSANMTLGRFPQAEAVTADKIGSDLKAESTSADGSFNFSYITTGEVIASHIAANANAVYRFSGASGRDLLFTQILITAYCPAGCTSCGLLFPAAITNHTPFNNRTAAQIVGDIGIGWNLGNTLDGYNSNSPEPSSETYPSSLKDFNNPSRVETVWQGGRAYRTTQSLVSAVKSAGFNAIRIPVTWYKAMPNLDMSRSSPDYTIDPRWMNHVQSIVDMAVREDMYIILNTHHEEYIMRFGNVEKSTGAVTALWTQIATKFKDYNEKLIFEGLNEPRRRNNSSWTESGVWSWDGNSTDYGIVNTWNQAFVNAVRATGGNNTNRCLMLATYGAQARTPQMDGLKLP
ncbi:MAG: cellulase family glycosylhydrolase, partial [Oscillospiraceae bacterium]|nr:cellulase family glycosylhydrolase [Oscillospiraceae bacterium]